MQPLSKFQGLCLCINGKAVPQIHMVLQGVPNKKKKKPKKKKG